MANPVLVEVTRGPMIESRHRGAAVVIDADGHVVLSLGEVERPVFPRSAVKAIQALPLVESGAADAASFGNRELALAQASHSGEPRHVEGVTAMLAAIGLDAAALECGTHAPSNGNAAAALIRSGGEPDARHNNCSGKHSGFLAVAKALGVPHAGYVDATHPAQQVVRETLVDLTGDAHVSSTCGLDGCSIPAYAVPLTALAHGFARFATGRGLAPERAAAARRLYAAAVAEPFYVAGSGRFDTEVMTLLRGAALLKTGAEGVYCAGFAALGLGVALKCDDGGTRAAEAMITAIVARLLPDHADAMRRWTHAPVLTRRGVQAGEVRVAEDAFAR